MIVQSLCQTCFQPYELVYLPPEIPLIKEISDEEGLTCPCPRLCGGRINVVPDSTITDMISGRRLAPVMILTGQGLFKAVQGAGLPDEIAKSPEAIDSLLKANQVVQTTVGEWNGKIYLHELYLSNGTIIHLSSGLVGAQVLKITRINNGDGHTSRSPTEG
jgi:hypothetical protein